MLFFALFNAESSNFKGYYIVSESKRWEKQNLFLPPASHVHCHKGVIYSKETLLRPRNVFFLLFMVFTLCFVFRKNVPRMLLSPPPNVLGFFLLYLPYTLSLPSRCQRELPPRPPVSLASPAASSCSTQGPWSMCSTLSTGTCALGVGRGQPLGFPAGHWMSWSHMPSSCVLDGL